MGKGRSAKKLGRQQAKERQKQIPHQGDTASEKILPPATPVAIDQELFSWSMQALDHEYEGDWDWKLSAGEVRNLLEVLEDLTGKTWREVKGLRTNSKRTTRQLHHDQPVGSMCRAAQKRLDDLALDIESVFRLRHGNLIRVWGYLQGPTFHIVWFDRHHKVCPSDG